MPRSATSPVPSAPPGHPAPPPPHGRFRRALGRAAALAATVVGLGGVFTAATVGGVVLHMDLRPARALAQRTVNDVLRSSLQGQIVLEGVDRLSLRRLDVREVAVRHPDGQEVLRASDVHATFSALAIVRNFLFGDDDLLIGISRVQIGHADVHLDEGQDGALRLEEAFAPTPSEPPTEPSAPARPVRLEIERAEIESAWVHGAFAPPQALDASVEGLVGSVVVGEEETRLELERAQITERRLLPVPIEARAAGRIRMVTDRPLEAAGEVSGSAGDIELAARGSLEDDRLSATVTIPRVTPAAAAAIQPGLPIHQPLSIDVTAEGMLTQVDVTARVGVLASDDAGSAAGGAAPAGAAGGEIVARARVDVLEPEHITARAEVRDVDLRTFAPAAPAMRVGARAEAAITLGEGAPRIVAEARTEPTVVEGQAVPAIDARATLEGGRLQGAATIHEPGAPIEAEVALSEDGALRLEARSEIPSLEAVPRLQGAASGRAALRVSGTLRNDTLRATAEARVRGVRVSPEIGLGQGELRAKVSGPLDALKVDASFRGADLRAEGYAFERVALGAAGPVTAPRVTASLAGADRRIDAAAQLDVGREEARAIRVEVARGEDAIGGRAARVGWGRGIAVEGLSLEGEGTGALEGGLSVRGERIEGELRGTALDLGRIARIAGVPVALGGLANVDVALRGAGRGRKGHVKIELEDGAVPGFAPRVSMNATALVEGEDLEAGGLVRLVVPPGGPPRAERPAPGRPAPCQGTIARVLLDGGRAKLRGSLLDARTWQSATGSARVVADDWQLRCLAEASPTALPVSEVAGRLAARIEIARGERQRFPSVRALWVRTSGLRVSGPADKRTGLPTWSSGALDVRLEGDLDGETGEARVSLAVGDRDVLAELSAGVDLDLEALVDRPEQRLAVLQRTPIGAHLAIPRRRLDDLGALPPEVRRSLPAMAGAAQVDAYVAGTLAAPRIVTRAIGWKVGPGSAWPASRTQVGTLDMDSLLVVDGQKAQLDAYALRGGESLLTARAKVEGNLAEVLASEPGEALPLDGSVEAKLHDLPLGELPFLADREIGGFVRGDVAVKGLFKAPEAAIHLEIPGLKFGPGGYFETAEASLEIAPPRDGQMSVARAKVALGAHDGGRLDAEAQTRIGWERGVVPTIAEDGDATASLSVKRFRLSTIEPLVAEQVSRLDGYLDGVVRLGLGAQPGFSGRMRLSEGVFQIPAIGQAFEKASLQVTATPSGELRIHDIRAEAGNGRVVGDAAVKMKGLAFQSARAELTIPDGRDLPVTMEGVPLGEARGKVIVAAVNKGKEIALDIQVPKLNLELPPTIGRSVQSLDENEEIVTSAPLSREEYEARTSPPDEPAAQAPGTPLVIQVHLGDVRLNGDMVQASITGDRRRPIRIEITDEARVGGDIKILSGKLEVLGKEFILEPSLVHLREEDSSNPYLNVTAYHDADDGTRIYIDYIGKLQPITEDKIHFRSDPPRPENEVLAQLLFGSDYDDGTLAGGSSAGEQPAAASGSPVRGAAAGVGAGVASAQINAILQSIGPLRHFETQLSTTEGGALRTSLGYELGERVTASASYQGAAQQRQGAPGGTAQGQRAQTEVSLEWRFVRDWILRAAVGTGESTTTSVDVLWKHRY